MQHELNGLRRACLNLTALDFQLVPPASGYDEALPGWKGQALAQVPVIRLFGVTSQGSSVCVHVHGFWPFFLCRAEQQCRSLTAAGLRRL